MEYIRARVIHKLGYKGSAYVARVPVVMTLNPETPEVITIGKETYIRIEEAPLTYKRVLTRRAFKEKIVKGCL